jgi:hypothetical protein
MADYDERLPQAEQLRRLSGKPRPRRKTVPFAERLAQAELLHNLVGCPRPTSKWEQLMCMRQHKRLHVSDWQRLEPRELLKQLLTDPTLAKHNPWWDGFDGAAWVQLLCQHPSLSGYCRQRHWDKLTSADCVRLLSAQPQLVKHVRADQLCLADWAILMHSRPKLFAHRKTAAGINRDGPPPTT